MWVMKPFNYHTCCIDANGADINAMTARARTITYRTMLKYCDLISWAHEQGYGRRTPDLTLRRDWYVSYHKSVYRGQPCYYMCHSAIEFIWTPGGVELPPPAANPPDPLRQLMGRFRT